MYTKADLKRVAIAYRKNFKELWRAGTKYFHSKIHMRLLKKEHKLYKKEIEIRKKLGCYMDNPCLLTGSISCEDCSGYLLKTEVGKTRQGYARYTYTSSNRPTNIKCKTKGVQCLM
jgi:hypothetical protein